MLRGAEGSKGAVQGAGLCFVGQRGSKGAVQGAGLCFVGQRKVKELSRVLRA